MRRVALIVLLALAAHGDTWSPPKRTTYESADDKWRVVTIPEEGESTPPYAEVFRRGDRGTWHRAATWNFVTGIFPLHAFVAKDGTVVTFDVRGPDDVVVIYRADGTVVRRLGLADLMATEDVAQLARTTSTIQWSGTHRLDEANRVLVLEIKAHRPEELPVSLDSGALLVTKRAMFPRPKVEWMAETAPPCMSAEELTERAVTTPVPPYPSVAWRARIGGDVLLELAIDKEGAVEQVTVLKPLPFGVSEAAEKAVSAWRFRPRPEKGCAQIRMSFDLTRP